MKVLIPFIAYFYATVAFLGVYATNIIAIAIGGLGLFAAFYLEDRS